MAGSYQRGCAVREPAQMFWRPTHAGGLAVVSTNVNLLARTVCCPVGRLLCGVVASFEAVP